MARHLLRAVVLIAAISAVASAQRFGSLREGPACRRGYALGVNVVLYARGRVVAVLQPAGDEDQKPWLRLRGTITRYNDPFEPAVDPSEWKALK